MFVIYVPDVVVRSCGPPLVVVGRELEGRPTCNRVDFKPHAWNQNRIGLTMATRTWKKERASERIDTWLKNMPLKDIEIKEFVRDTDLTNLPGNVAYRLDGAHLYADILNLSDMLHVTDAEGETGHRRRLRFLNLHHRAVYRILQRAEAIFVDFHNQRLHSVVAKPYDSDVKRAQRAVAIGQLIIDVLARTGEDADHPAAKVRGLSRVRTELFQLLVIPSLAPHPVHANRQSPRHGDLGDLPSPPHRQVEILTAPLRIAAHRDLRRFHQQEAQ